MLTRSKARILTGVGAVLTADHRSRRGEVHGHTWEITVWLSYDGLDALTARHILEDILAPHQGKCLPDTLAWAEQLAPWVAARFHEELFPREAVRVTVARQAERLFAEWRAA